MVGGIAIILFAILLRFCGLIIIPLILGIVGLVMALSQGKSSEHDPWEDENVETQSGYSDIGTTLDCETEQYEYDEKADKYF
ncbi:MAG: hypothetical protein IKZ82_03775 [Clostridia bacterium]|nr:hypothetical protein [Clostridia bacterium]